MTEQEDLIILLLDTTRTWTTLPTSKEGRDLCGKSKKNRRQINPTLKEPKFESHTDEIKDNIYDLNYNMSDQYTTTTQAIYEHVGRICKNGAAVRTSIEQPTTLVIVLPTDPIAPNVLELRIW